MALQHKEEKYTKFIYVENGRTIVRRMHRMEIQDRLGRTWTISSDQLPNAIIGHAGQKFKGAHPAQILLGPEKIKSRDLIAPPNAGPWPSLRDAVNWGLVLMAIAMIKFVSALAQAAM